MIASATNRNRIGSLISRRARYAVVLFCIITLGGLNQIAFHVLGLEKPTFWLPFLGLRKLPVLLNADLVTWWLPSMFFSIGLCIVPRIFPRLIGSNYQEPELRVKSRRRQWLLDALGLGYIFLLLFMYKPGL